jgi:hypothetical protein
LEKYVEFLKCKQGKQCKIRIFDCKEFVKLDNIPDIFILSTKIKDQFCLSFCSFNSIAGTINCDVLSHGEQLSKNDVTNTMEELLKKSDLIRLVFVNIWNSSNEWVDMSDTNLKAACKLKKILLGTLILFILFI